jgi:hypothetical protein
MKFALLMLAVHFPVYWLPPGGRQRYIIMLYPFIIQIFTYFFLIFSDKEKEKYNLFKVIVMLTTALGAVACLVPLFIESMAFIEGLWIICIASFLLLGSIFIFQLKKPQHAIISLLTLLLILRLVFGFTVLPVRSTEGAAPANKKAATEIIQIAGNKEVCILNPTYLHMQTIFYFEKEKQEILPRCNRLEPGKLYIAEKIILEEYSFRKEINKLMINPLKLVSEPFTGDDRRIIPGRDYAIIRELRLQKRDYLLVVPVTY